MTTLTVRTGGFRAWSWGWFHNVPLGSHFNYQATDALRPGEYQNICSNMEHFCPNLANTNKWNVETCWGSAQGVNPGSDMLHVNLLQQALVPRLLAWAANKHGNHDTFYAFAYKKPQWPKGRGEPKTKVFLCHSKFMCQSKINKLTKRPSSSFHLILTTALGYSRQFEPST